MTTELTGNELNLARAFFDSLSFSPAIADREIPEIKRKIHELVSTEVRKMMETGEMTDVNLQVEGAMDKEVHITLDSGKKITWKMSFRQKGAQNCAP